MKSEKGYTGIDIAISVVVIFIFVSIIASLSYRFNSSSKEVELKAEATALAIEEIEKLKNTLSFEEIEDRSTVNKNNQYLPTDTTKEVEEIETGFFRRALIEDYADSSNATKIPGILKKVTVQVQYMFKGKEQTVELSTIISKES